MPLPDIQRVVPQSGRMLLLDRIVAADADTITTEVTVREGSLFCDRRSGGVGAWVGLEYMAQTIAAFAGYEAMRHGQAVPPGLLLGTRRYTSTAPLFPLGATLHITVRRDTTGAPGITSFDCRIAGNGVAADAVVTVLHGAAAGGRLDSSRA
jgi:predicted hotdog family 3-hydroxylacyl-ACP dehydratase